MGREVFVIQDRHSWPKLDGFFVFLSDTTARKYLKDCREADQNKPILTWKVPEGFIVPELEPGHLYFELASEYFSLVSGLFEENEKERERV